MLLHYIKKFPPDFPPTNLQKLIENCFMEDSLLKDANFSAETICHFCGCLFLFLGPGMIMEISAFFWGNHEGG